MVIGGRDMVFWWGKFVVRCDRKKTSTSAGLLLSRHTDGNLLNGVWSEEKYGWQCGSNVHGIDLSRLAGG
jgi:hypothetical protein